MQPCGECRLCCKVFPVPILDKPAGAWCRHNCATGCEVGCAIHGPDLPEICRQYDCYWRDHDELPPEFRPDRIGLVATEAGSVSVGPWTLPVVVFQEDFAGASQGAQAANLLARLASRGAAVAIIHGLTARIVYDAVDYPGISAEAIEAVLRYELSQDAEELHRLGAVDGDYRPLSRDEAAALCREEREGSDTDRRTE